MSRPLVSIVTATRGFSDLLMTRCIPSVQRQIYPNVEHVIVSEPDDDLRVTLRATGETPVPIRYFETGPWRGQRDRQYDQPGAAAYGLGVQQAHGEFIGYCGDDDELLDNHALVMVNAIEARGVDFATSIADFRVNGARLTLIGDGTLRKCTLDTISIVHRRDTRGITWREDGGVADWQLVEDFTQAGLTHTHVQLVTGIHHDGRYAEIPR